TGFLYRVGRRSGDELECIASMSIFRSVRRESLVFQGGRFSNTRIAGRFGMESVLPLVLFLWAALVWAAEMVCNWREALPCGGLVARTCGPEKACAYVHPSKNRVA